LIFTILHDNRTRPQFPVSPTSHFQGSARISQFQILARFTANGGRTHPNLRGYCNQSHHSWQCPHVRNDGRYREETSFLRAALGAVLEYSPFPTPIVLTIIMVYYLLIWWILIVVSIVSLSIGGLPVASGTSLEEVATMFRALKSGYRHSRF
jgi:hypothetical protein